MRYLLISLLLVVPLAAATADDQLPVVAQDDFQDGDAKWEILDPPNWRVQRDADRDLLRLVGKAPEYRPPHRSPTHIALLKAPLVTDFELNVRLRSTERDYGHRDVCLFFGYQDQAHFYYAHLARDRDPHAHQVFLVNKADRTKITNSDHPGAPWDDHWHTLRVVRDTQDGKIEVYWDDQPKPMLTAQDKTFTWGYVGLGSFDDTVDFDRVTLRGVVPKPDPEHGITLQTTPLQQRPIDPDNLPNGVAPRRQAE